MAEFDLNEQGIAGLTLMKRIREFEDRLPGLSQEGVIRGSTHPSSGMEAVSVGVSLALEDRDAIASNHRGHAHTLAKGADFKKTMAEILGREDGYCGGKGGSMHLGVKEIGVLGTNGIVGAGIGVATGAALASQVLGDGSVAVAYFGDGGSNQGVLAEAFNLSAIWKLPVIFVLENNYYAQSASIEDMVAQRDFTKRGEAYGVPSFEVDGMDVQAVYDVMESAVERARAGEGPSFIVANTYRYLGHMAGDTEIYRDATEVEAWRAKDPVAKLEGRLIEAGILSKADLEKLEADITAEIDEVVEFAKNSPYPAIETAFTDVYAS